MVIDPCFGAAGDMILGSLLSLGADMKAVLKAVSFVSSPEITNVNRCGVSAVYIKTKTQKTHRTFREVCDIIDESDASHDAKEFAKKVFERIQNAESKVHDSHHVHFHEVGADDAIADVLGSCTAFLSLNVDGVFVKPVALGSGTVECSHGIMNVPVPAVREIVENSSLKVSLESFSGELCTPTGAALLAEFSQSFGVDAKPVGRLVKSGNGAGTRNPSDHPNILSAYIIETEDDENFVDVLETNVDDVSGEIIGSTFSKLMECGARDVSAAPIIMKKGRPGYLLRVVCKPEDSKELAKILALNTGSLGIRCMPMVHRFAAERYIESVTIEINGKEYDANVKTALSHGVVYNRKAEFEDCAKIAEQTGLCVKDVKRIVEESSWKNL